MSDKTSPKFIDFLRGRLSRVNLPQKIELSKDLWQVMDKLWQRSIKHIDQARVSEWGGMLVLDKMDNLKLVNVTKGTANNLTLQIPQQSNFVGSFHTHPYTDGTTGIAFSGADIADAINNRERISTLQSGSDVFALIGTDTVPFAVNRENLKSEHAALHYYYLSQGMQDKQAVYYTNLDICQTYKIAFYAGGVFQPLWEIYQP